MEFLLSLPVLILIVVVVFGFKSFIVVPQQEVYVVERLGRFHKALTEIGRASCRERVCLYV